jgi:hypothetical protein
MQAHASGRQQKRLPITIDRSSIKMDRQPHRATKHWVRIRHNPCMGIESRPLKAVEKKARREAGLTGVRRISAKDRFTMRQNEI